jgi:tRNA threonylcarbamoyladenosine biosynthesis protein TsaE
MPVEAHPPVHWISESPEATEALGQALGRALGRGAVLALVGEMGAGKTCLVRGLAAGLGVPEDEVASPTYTLMHAHQGRLPLYHFDAWMSAREGAFLAGGGAEVLEHGAEGEGVAVLEWARDVGEFLPLPRLECRLEHAGERRRAVRLLLLGEPGERPEAALPAALEAARALARTGAGTRTVQPAPEIRSGTEPPGPAGVRPLP